jgi:hypothetical protein
LKDFFISYTEIDKPWAEWIGWVLEEAGYSAVLQHWDFAEAGNFVLDMHRAVAEASQTIAVLSQEYLCSKFCAAEWIAAFAKDPDGLKHRLLPVRARECQLDGLRTAITHIDLVGLDGQCAEQRLLSRVRRKRGKPTERPPFPATRSTRSSRAGPEQPLI